MIQLPICPVCTGPVVEQPAEDWINAYRSGAGPWWHLADNSPICPGRDGDHCQAVFVEDQLPADDETSTWIDAMTDLFAIDGPFNPARLGSAITAAEHLTRWLHTATGPYSALLTLPTPADVASLIGHLHRSGRLLARVNAQTGSYLIDQVQEQATGFGNEGDVPGTIIDAADDAHACLQDAADWSAESASATGVAWSIARTIAGPPPTAKTSGAVPVPPAVLLTELVEVALGGEAPRGPELGPASGRMLQVLHTYLLDCAGLARPVAISTPLVLADLTIALTYLTNTVYDSLRQFIEHQTESDVTGDDTDDAVLRDLLVQAGDGLRGAARTLARASYHAARAAEMPPQDQP